MAKDMVSVEVKGLDAVQHELRALARNLGPKIVGEALREEAEIIMTESKRRCPVDTGALVGSGHVEGPTGPNAQVRLVYGGPAAPYALTVHEMPPNTSWKKRNATNKFLEQPVHEAVANLAQKVAARAAKKASF